MDASAVEAVDSSSEAHVWRAVASERMMLGQEQEVVSAKEFGESHYLDIVAYRLEERRDTQIANGV